MAQKNSCCDVSIDNFNPFSIQRGEKKKSRNYQFFDIDPPLLEVVRNTDDLTKYFKDEKWIPFAGTNKAYAHKMVKVLLDYRYHSHTHGAVVTSISDHAIRNTKFRFVRCSDPDFEIDEVLENLTTQQQKDYLNFIKSLKFYCMGSEISLKDFCANVSEFYDLTGNAWIECKMTRTLGVPAISFTLHSPVEWVYKITEGEPRIAGYSTKWYDAQYLRENPPLEVPVYPYMDDYSDGTTRTVIHIKHGYNWHYGRPPAFSSFKDWFDEGNLRSFLSKQIRGGFVPSVYIEGEDEKQDFLNNESMAKEAGYSSFADQFEQNYTNRGEDPSGVMVGSRPYGAKESLVHEFKGMQNQKYLQTVLELLQKNIIVGHGWSRALLEMDYTQGFNSGMYKDVFQIKSATKIKSRQDLVSRMVKTLAEIAELWIGTNEFEDFAIQPVSPVQNLIDQAAGEAEEKNTIEDVD